jgi:hypothetical protein
MFERRYGDEHLLIIHNLAGKQAEIKVPVNISNIERDVLGQNLKADGARIFLEPHAVLWISL